jgi:DNA mismatch repair protein MutS2
MRSELDASFKSAHAEIARVIADLQRAPSSRRAASARERLEAVRDETRREQQARGLVPEPRPVEADADGGRRIDWQQVHIGDGVRTPGGGRGTILALPDRRGRVAVRVGSARVLIDCEALRGDPGGGPSQERARLPTAGAQADLRPPPRLGGVTECDLRGLRVEEALDRLDQVVDTAMAEGRDELRIIHGLGTGALRRAVRERLSRSRFITECCEAGRDEGGAGATRAVFGKDEE